jgi:hypothetical protein
MRLLAGLEMNSLQLPAQDIQGRLRDDQSGGDTGDHPPARPHFTQAVFFFSIRKVQRVRPCISFEYEIFPFILRNIIYNMLILNKKVLCQACHAGYGF